MCSRNQHFAGFKPQNLSSETAKSRFKIRIIRELLMGILLFYRILDHSFFFRLRIHRTPFGSYLVDFGQVLF